MAHLEGAGGGGSGHGGFLDDGEDAPSLGRARLRNGCAPAPTYTPMGYSGPMVAQQIEFGRRDAEGQADCACHGAHASNPPQSAPSTGDVVTDLAVDGMTCAHCVRAVTTELGALAGVGAVEVELVADGTSRVRVHSSAPLDTAAVAAAIDEAGYTLHA